MLLKDIVMKKILVAVFSVFVITACSEEVKSIDYYMDNLEEAEAVKNKCEVTQGSKNDQNCINADKALYRDYMNKMTGNY